MSIFGLFFKFHYIKSPFSGKIRHANGLCQVIYLLKKSTFGVIKLWLNLYSREAVQHKLKNSLKTQKLFGALFMYISDDSINS